MSNRMRTRETKTNLVARRRRAITIVGALIVFATFVIKDGVREYLRDLKNSLGEADNLYSLEQDVGAVQLQLVALQEEMNGTAVRQKTAEPGGAKNLHYAAEIRSTLAMMKERDAALGDEFNRISRLVQRMPISKAVIKDSLQKTDEAITKFHEVAKRKEEEVGSSPQDGEALTTAQVNLAFLVLAEVPIVSMGSGVLELARSEEENLDAAYDRYTWAALALYALGWGLSFYGVLSGLPAVGNQD